MLFSLDIIIFPFFFMDRVSIVNLFYPRYIFNPRKMVLVVNSYSISIFLLVFSLLVGVCFKRHSVDGIDIQFLLFLALFPFFICIL